MIKPAAKVLKSRLVYGNLRQPAELRPMFDPYIKEFTWERVREYMKTGADPDNLQMPPEPSEEEKRMRELELKAEIARAETARIEAGLPPASDEKVKCPVCKVTASLNSDNGHAPWCKMGENGQRYDAREKEPA